MKKKMLILGIVATIILLVIIGNQVYRRYFYIPNYHVSVNQNDIKEILINFNGNKKVVSTKDGSLIINEFNKSKITSVRKLNGFENSNLNVLFIFNNSHNISFTIKDNMIKVSRIIGTRKVEYIAENEKLKNIITQLLSGN